jgi:hypothetical protein
MVTIIYLLIVIVVGVFLHSTTTTTTTSTPLSSIFVESKEIVATHEWQRLGENDTLPAGLHVRMDLSTGEKWAKLPSDDDDDDKNENMEKTTENAGGGSGSKTIISPSSSVAVMDGTGALTILDTNDHHSPDSISNNDASNNQVDSEKEEEEEEEEDDDEAKYLMMHRVMSKLPPEELERFGGLPALPSPVHNNSNNTDTTSMMEQLTAEQRQLFQTRMEELWTLRQMELKEAQDTLANFPEMLKERIVTLTKYLEDVGGSLQLLLEERHQQQQQHAKDDENVDDTEDEDEGVALANDIVSALRDLEDLLSDVDNARDFHTLGGWSILVALLDERLHQYSSASSSMSIDVYAGEAEKVMVLVDEIRALAALCIGTAVSNLEEFRFWALEDVSSVISDLRHKQHSAVHKEEITRDTVSALSLLISSFEDELSLRSQFMGDGSMAIPINNTAAAAASITPPWSKARYHSHATYKLRAIYALGALLRGNPPAQQYFAVHSGPETIVRDALGTLSSVRGPDALADGTLTRLDYKFASKVLALGEDVIMDVLLHGDEYKITVPSTNYTEEAPSSSSPSSSSGGKDEESETVQKLTANQLVAAFTSEWWCDLSLRMLFPPFEILGRTFTLGIQEKAMRSVGAMAPACGIRQGPSSNIKVSGNKVWGLEEVKRVRSEWNREGSDDGIDSRYRRELLELADGVLEALLQ